jgi:hypothetical protein
MRSSRPEGYRVIVSSEEKFGLWIKSSDSPMTATGGKKVSLDINQTEIGSDTPVSKTQELTVRLRQVEYCKNGEKYKMLILCSEPYES